MKTAVGFSSGGCFVFGDIPRKLVLEIHKLRTFYFIHFKRM